MDYAVEYIYYHTFFSITLTWLIATLRNDGKLDSNVDDVLWRVACFSATLAAIKFFYVYPTILAIEP